MRVRREAVSADADKVLGKKQDIPAGAWIFWQGRRQISGKRSAPDHVDHQEAIPGSAIFYDGTQHGIPGGTLLSEKV